MEQKSLGEWAKLDLFEFNKLSPEEKRRRLYAKQVAVLDNFLERNAITRSQYELSVHDLTEKMGMNQR